MLKVYICEDEYYQQLYLKEIISNTICIENYDMELSLVTSNPYKLLDNIKDTNTRVLSGMDGLIEAATLENADLVVNSVVGMVGLKPTLAAANAKKDIAFANKETLVTGGKLVMR